MSSRLILMISSILFTSFFAVVMREQADGIAEGLRPNANVVSPSQVFEEPAQALPPIDLSTAAGLFSSIRALQPVLTSPEVLTTSQLPTRGSSGYRGLLTLTSSDIAMKDFHGDFRMRVFFSGGTEILGGVHLGTMALRRDNAELLSLRAVLRTRSGFVQKTADAEEATFQARIVGDLWLPDPRNSSGPQKPYGANGVLAGTFTKNGAVGSIDLTATDEAGQTLAFSGVLVTVAERFQD